MAVNTSVGIDGAFPNEEPIWCSLYDSLGHAGILSSIATTNSNVDVGIAGDIPSLCPSPFTIVVNNTDANDNRMGSGYNKEFVDMAAPGQGVFRRWRRLSAGVFYWLVRRAAAHPKP